MARFYSNENFPLPVVQALREFGHDVLTVQEAAQDNRAIPDEDVLAFAHSQGRAVLTINRKDFLRLHRTSPSHSGILICTADRDFAEQARRIHDEVVQYNSLTGLLIRINRPA